MTDIAAGKSAGLELGPVVGRTVEALRSNLLPFAGLALLLTALPDAIVGALAMNSGAGMGVLFQIVGGLVGFVAGAVLQAGVMHGALVGFGGGKATFADCLRTATRTFLPVAGISILVSCGVFLGSILLIVPGIILALMWAVAIPVQVAERPGVIDALKRSAALTKGNRFAIFWMSLVFGVVAVVIYGVVAGISVAILGPSAPFLVLILSPLASAALALLAACWGAALYYELRTRKEGIAPAALASVFD